MMLRRSLSWLLVGGWLGLPLAAAPAGPAGALVRHEASRMSMGCAYAIVAYGRDGAALPGIVDAAFDEVDRIDRLMSHYKPESELSRLNREAAAAPVTVDPELFGLIAESLRYSRESDGAFDITVGPLMKAWGFFRGGGRVPGSDELADLRDRVGYAHVLLDASQRTIRFDRPGVELDLGGIAKGYAVDRAVGLLREHHVVAALVSAGGSTVFGLGAPPGQAAWEVGVQDPVAPGAVAFDAHLKDRALSISGSYEKSFEKDGVTYSHIMDPRAARPVQGVWSVAVLAPSGTAGDALDDAFFVQGVARSRAYVKRLPGTEAFFFLPSPRRRWTLVHLHGPGHFAAGRSITP
ncbi:MAG TPA: FAD:protein FMN transferase [Vicinamibacteria bacterium]|nr:FAD:protein FMN transferase [Vicinamibacteria bacterium]